MKNLFFAIFLISNILLKAQNFCAPTYTSGEIFYPNTTNTPTNYIFARYLCGPNTIVYDTVAFGYISFYVNPGATLFYKLNCQILAKFG